MSLPNSYLKGVSSPELRSITFSSRQTASASWVSRCFLYSPAAVSSGALKRRTSGGDLQGLPATNGSTNTNQAPERSDIALQIVLAVLIDCVGHKQAQRSHNGTDEKQDDDDCLKHWLLGPHFLVATPITTGYCCAFGRNPIQHALPCGLHCPSGGSVRCRRASSELQRLHWIAGALRL